MRFPLNYTLSYECHIHSQFYAINDQVLYIFLIFRGAPSGYELSQNSIVASLNLSLEQSIKAHIVGLRTLVSTFSLVFALEYVHKTISYKNFTDREIGNYIGNFIRTSPTLKSGREITAGWPFHRPTVSCIIGLSELLLLRRAFDIIKMRY